MARARQPEPTTPTGFLASAVRLPTASRNMAGRSEGWQNQAWTYWESVGELRAVSVWIGNVLSRAVLVAAKRVGNMLTPVTSGPAADAIDALYGGPQGQTEMLQNLGVHLTVAGEAYIVYRSSNDHWDTLATNKVTQLPGRKNGTLGIQADFGTEGGAIPLTTNDLAMRMWTPHPRDPTRPDSPVRATLTTLAQIVGYDQHISAQVRSRLAGAGILFLSSEVEFPVPPGADPTASPATHFMNMLGEAMMTPIEDPGDPSALVPIVAMVPTESLGKNEHVRFWSDLDAAAVSMRDAAIKRLALGLDVPPEVLLGVGDVNHWNAWLSEESAIKAHIEPRLAIITYALTEAYLRPALTGMGVNPEDFYIIADTSGIRLRPNRSTEAIELYDRGELSGPALRRETGFHPEDAPAKDQMVTWLLRKIATGSTSPEQTQAALALLGADLGLGMGINTPPPDNMRTNTVPSLPTRNPPDQAVAQANATRTSRGRGDGLAAAAEALVYRALERAGNRLRNTHPRTDTANLIPVEIYKHLPGDADALLAGAWTTAAEQLDPYTDDPDNVIDTLDFYVRGLLATKRPHSAVVLRALLDSRPTALPVGNRVEA